MFRGEDHGKISTNYAHVLDVQLKFEKDADAKDFYSECVEAVSGHDSVVSRPHLTKENKSSLLSLTFGVRDEDDLEDLTEKFESFVDKFSKKRPVEAVYSSGYRT